MLSSIEYIMWPYLLPLVAPSHVQHHTQGEFVVVVAIVFDLCIC